MTDEELWLYTLCKKNNLPITDIQIQTLTHFKNLLLEWNKKINLISRKNEDNLWKGHIVLSLSMLFKIKFPTGANILDLGTGGGFPGIPLAVMLPECSFLLLDSTQKKINAVQSMAEALNLQNIQTIWGRAEDVQKNKVLKNSFHAVVARSVSNLSNLLDWGLPFLMPPSNSKNSYDAEKKIISIITPSLITFKGREISDEESSALSRYPNIQLSNIPLVFSGSEDFDNLDKKLVIVTK